MKKTVKLLALVLAVALLAVSLTACAGNTASQDQSTLESTASQLESDLSSAASELESAASQLTSEIVQSVDFTKPDVTIEYGDFDGIVSFTNDMLAGKYDGQVVRAEGISSKRMSNCALLEANAAGDEKRGFTWQLQDAPEMSAYPAEDAHVIITGIVVVGEYDVRYLMVPADQVQVVE